MLIRADVQHKIDEVFKDLHDHVALSLGPDGHTVMIAQDKGRPPITTKDGVTIANHYKAPDKLGELVTSIIKESCQATDKKVGDGTTSTIIYAYDLYNKLRKAIDLNQNYNSLLEGINEAILDIQDKVLDYAVEVKSPLDMKQVAFVSANNDQVIADLLYEAIDKSGKNGAIITSKSLAGKTRVEMREGFCHEAELISKVFVNDQVNNLVRYENPRVIVTNHILRDLKKDMETLMRFHQQDGRPIVLYAENIEESALAALIYQANERDMKICPIRLPYYGRAKEGFIEDLAKFVGAEIIMKEDGRAFGEKIELINDGNKTVKYWGQAKYFELNHNQALIVGGNTKSEVIENQIKHLKDLRDTCVEDMELFEIYQNRISRLGSSSATIYIGGHTDSEITEKRYRIEDALKAIKAATTHGVIPGGGIVGLRIAAELVDKHKDKQATNPAFYWGYKSTVESLRSFFHQLMISGKMEEFEYKYANQILENANPDYGLNLLTKKFEDLRKGGIIEPAITLINVIHNSASIVKLLLNSNAVIL